MRVSLNWLKEYIDISDFSASEIAEKLDLSGTEVENITHEGRGLDNVVVGRIDKIMPHPNADRLVLCEVYTGIETKQIVCGAKNMKEKDKVAVALPGAKLPNGIKIKEASIRGEKSFGMLASEVELGLAENSSGIMILGSDQQAGERLDIALDLTDKILELEITPNRPDLMSMIGIARELGAILGLDYKINPTKIKEEEKTAQNHVKVSIKDKELNPRYIAKIITDVKVSESPYWLKKRIIAAGARPINNLVDITNYVLFETGQPLHAFDYDLLDGSEIITRRAKQGEKFITLDGVERKLSSKNLIISDKNKAVALAGVMGGANSEVNDNTKTVLLESAYFNPANIGYSSRGLGLISESSIRFERGVDPNSTDYAADRAAQLMQEIAGGKVLRGSVDEYPSPVKLNEISLRPTRANKILGTDIEKNEIKQMLSSIELEVVDGEDLKVGVPTFRPDLTREIDLIEEIGRLYGLNKIKSTLPGVAQVGRVTKLDELQNTLRNQLIGFGLKEALNYSFVDPKLLERFEKAGTNLVRLKNPLSEEQSVLRTSLLPGLFNSLMYNLSRKQKNVNLFEIGTVFIPTNSLPDEQPHLGIILSSSLRASSWQIKEDNLDFFDIKGVIEAIANNLKIDENFTYKAIERNMFHPQKSFEISLAGSNFAFIGEFHPKFLKENDIKGAVYAEMDLAVLQKYRQAEVPFKGIAAYPGIVLDISFLVDEAISHKDIVRSIKEMGHNLLTEINLFDVYKGEGIEEGKKSMAYSLSYQSLERTLELSEVQKIHEEIIENLKADLKVEIR